jgi:1,4-dihydroxy-2-naphthoate octaprenyltransferase
LKKIDAFGWFVLVLLFAPLVITFAVAEDNRRSYLQWSLASLFSILTPGVTFACIQMARLNSATDVFDSLFDYRKALDDARRRNCWSDNPNGNDMKGLHIEIQTHFAGLANQCLVLLALGMATLFTNKDSFVIFVGFVVPFAVVLFPAFYSGEFAPIDAYKAAPGGITPGPCGAPITWMRITILLLTFSLVYWDNALKPLVRNLH